MQKITTFLMFNDKAGEAVNFYLSVFNSSKLVSTMPGPDGRVMGYTFEIDGQEFQTYNGGPHFTFAEGMSLMVNCETQDEIDHLWEKLSEGGEKQPCGWLKDRFGVSWQVVPTALGEMLGDDDRERADRVMQAMLKMARSSFPSCSAPTRERPRRARRQLEPPGVGHRRGDSLASGRPPASWSIL